MSTKRKAQGHEAPVHARLREHREAPSIDLLRGILNEHHQTTPTAFVWVEDLLLILEDLEARLARLEGKSV